MAVTTEAATIGVDDFAPVFASRTSVLEECRHQHRPTTPITVVGGDGAGTVTLGKS